MKFINFKSRQFGRICGAFTIALALFITAACNSPENTNTAGNAPGGTSPGNTTAPTANAGTVPTAALPDSGYRAGISVASAPQTIRAGQKETINVRIKNTSDQTWNAGKPATADGKFLLNVGNHWLDAAGKVISENDARTTLPKDVKPGEEIEVPLRVTAPAAAGEYTLEIDMVQELVAWFGRKGSTTYKTKVRVEK